MESLEERFWSKADVRGDNECWPWRASKDRDGYGKFNGPTSEGVRPMLRAHRVAYELMVTPVPEGLVLDHLCRNRACVNPWHLQVVPVALNSNRKGLASVFPPIPRPTCTRGHDFTDENTYEWRGKRWCRTCRREREEMATVRESA